LNFGRATRLIDSATAGVSTNDSGDDGAGRSSQFFSGNVASLSNTFADLHNEQVSSYWKNGVLHQSVKYAWSSDGR
jgi:hypothetical protein